MKVNGKTVVLEEAQTLGIFLATQQFDCKTIAVELNGQILPRSAFDQTVLTNEDTLEVVRFVGGG